MGSHKDDLIEGAAAIAAYLNDEGLGHWTERRVYSAREKGWSIPIRRREGLGIYAFKSELAAWFTDDETLPPAARAA